MDGETNSTLPAQMPAWISPWPFCSMVQRSMQNYKEKNANRHCTAKSNTHTHFPQTVQYIALEICKNASKSCFAVSKSCKEAHCIALKKEQAKKYKRIALQKGVCAVHFIEEACKPITKMCCKICKLASSCKCQNRADLLQSTTN